MKKSCCPAESAVRPDNKFKIIPGEPVTDIVCFGIRKTIFIPGEPVSDIVCYGIGNYLDVLQLDISLPFFCC